MALNLCAEPNVALFILEKILQYYGTNHLNAKNSKARYYMATIVFVL